jgi:hypothetical protein
MAKLARLVLCRLLRHHRPGHRHYAQAWTTGFLAPCRRCGGLWYYSRSGHCMELPVPRRRG